MRRFIQNIMVGTALLGMGCPTYASELHDAVRAQDRNAVEAALSAGAAIDESDFMLGTALHLAVSGGNLDIARLLIENGADMEAVSEQQGSRAVHLAAHFGNADMLSLLLDHGAQLEARDDLQRTPLLRASVTGHVDAVRLLIDRGADMHARDERYGDTALHEAAHHGHIDVVKLLLERGADIDVTSNAGRTPFRSAATPQSYTVVGDASLLEYLVARGADPNAKDSSGVTALAYAEFQARQGDAVMAVIADELRRLGATE